MTYKLKHYLFGWDYIAWHNCAASGIARILTDFNGRVFYWRYRSIKVADVITDHNQVLWLTCAPSKYLPTKEKP